MKYKIVLLSLISILIAGCSASGQIVKQRNMMNMFTTNSPVDSVAQKISEMSKYCGSGIYKIEQNDFTSIGKTTLDFYAGDGSNKFYASRVEIEKISEQNTKIGIYEYFNTEVTRNKAKQMELWINGNSTQCVPGF